MLLDFDPNKLLNSKISNRRSHAGKVHENSEALRRTRIVKLDARTHTPLLVELRAHTT